MYAPLGVHAQFFELNFKIEHKQTFYLTVINFFLIEHVWKKLDYYLR